MKVWWLLPWVVVLLGCDPLRKKKCEWYLTPNQKPDGATKIGFVSLCVSNFQLERQRCYFVAKPELVEEFKGKPFRYDEMEFTKDFPREITHLAHCKSES